MGIKQKLGMGVATAVLGISLIGGGTYAYFSDQEVSQNTFAAGTLDLTLNPTALVDVSNIKPGDSMFREFTLTNNGTLDIKNVNLLTDYAVVDAKGDNGSEDFGKHIKVNFLWNWDKEAEPIFETTLSELKAMSPDLVQANIMDPALKGGLKPGEVNELWVEYVFEDNGADQNVFQGDSLSLEWTFNATQGEGEEK